MAFPAEQTTSPYNLRAVLWLGLAVAALLSLAACLAFLFADKDIGAWAGSHGPELRKGLWIGLFKLLGKGLTMIVLLGVWALVTRNWKALVIGLLSLTLVAAVVLPLKGIVRRPRPTQDQSPENPDRARFFRSWSFPSGDTAGAFALAVALTPFLRTRWRVVLFVLVAAIGIERVVLGYHFPSDVFAGAAIGVVLGLCALLLCRRWVDRPPPLPTG